MVANCFECNSKNPLLCEHCNNEFYNHIDTGKCLDVIYTIFYWFILIKNGIKFN